jgi:hypothetical protein
MSGVDVSIHHVEEIRITAPQTLNTSGCRVQDIVIVYRDLCDGEWVTCESELTLFFEDTGTPAQTTEEE